MDSNDSKFLFGAAEEGTSGGAVLEKVHLATRGVGDWQSLARALNECRRNCRYLTEGSIVRARADKTRNGSSECLLSDQLSDHGHHPGGLCAPSGDHSGISDGINAPKAGDNSPCNLATNSTSANKGRRLPRLTKHPSHQNVISTNLDKDKPSHSVPSEQISSFISACSAAFDFTRSMSQGDSHDQGDDSTTYIIVKCEPQGGYIGESTLFYTDERLPELRRLDLLWDLESESHVNRCVEHLLGPTDATILSRSTLLQQEHMFGPYHVDPDASKSAPPSSRVRKTIFLNRQDTQTSTSDHKDLNTAMSALFQEMFKSVASEALSSDTRVYYSGQYLTIRDLKMFVSRTRPRSRPGIITPATDIYLGIDTVGECTSVSVAPLCDTLPKAYEYNLLRDCVEPYFRGQRSRTFHVDDVFRFGGVQFRIVGFEHRDDLSQLFDFDLLQPFPLRGNQGRVGSRSAIYLRDPVPPQLTDLLSGDQLRCLRRCAPSQKELLLFKLMSQLDSESIERLYNHGQDFSVADGRTTGGLYIPVSTPFQGDTTTTTEATCLEPLPTTYCPSIVPADSIQRYNITDSPSSLVPDICTVCYDPIDGDIFTYTCGHAFHRSCANGWMHMCGNSCPNCRRQFTLPVDNGGSGQFTISDEEVLSDPGGPECLSDSASSSGASDLLHWFNSQEF
ncbi:ring zinc finger domain containing protein, putative [Babesia ovis]|uniref:Ring zinc finger domain containing protein, putative n=1 Tax=Babesia ovis TaxID=5869 RepID=A0A9W5TD70_BABOV|nr:ring zinc finger domain containing protein, putative [Babesia ovis]